MFPIPVPMWESDATGRAAIEQSYAADALDMGQNVAMTGGEGSLDLQTRDPLTLYNLRLKGLYARSVAATPGASGELPPVDNMSAELGANGGWQLSPFVRLTLDAEGYLATTLGIRADDALAARDPFMANRLQYAIGGGTTLTTVETRSSYLTWSAGYLQAGALAADRPEAVGIDAHTGRAGVAYTTEFGKLDFVTPELRYQYTHFYHAILDVDLDRGPADVHVGTALVTETHYFSRTFSGAATGGVSVASPPPIVGAKSVVVEPDVRAALTLYGRRYRGEASYEYAYTSLGPRIGFGMAHTAAAELSVRPHDGAAFRDFWVRGIGRFSYGAMPVAAEPPLNTTAPTPGVPRSPPPTGTLTTYVAAAGARVDYPIFRGIVATGGVDLEYIRAVFDPETPLTSSGSMLATIWTIGIAGVLSTEPRNRVRPEQQELPDERVPRGPDDTHAGPVDPRAATIRYEEAQAEQSLNPTIVDGPRPDAASAAPPGAEATKPPGEAPAPDAGAASGSGGGSARPDAQQNDANGVQQDR